MATNVAEKVFPDELPTKPVTPTTSRELARASRIDRLAEPALERLRTEPDPEAIAAACGELAQIQALASEVLR